MEQNGWKERYLDIIEEMDEGYAEFDLKGNLTRVNKVICKIWGYTRDEMVGENFRKFISPKSVKENFEVFKTILETGNPIKSHLFEGVRNDGTNRLIEVSVSLIKDEKGNPVRLRGIYRDITDHRKTQKQLDAQKSRLGAILQSVRDGIVTVDPNMNLIEYNEAAGDVCSLLSEIEIGQPLVDVNKQCDNACLNVLQDTLLRKASINRFDFLCSRNKSSAKSLLMSTIPLLNADEEHLGAMLFIRDVTRLRELERQLSDYDQYHDIIGKSRQMQEIYSLLENLKDLETTVLVTGENGTGKELIARALHYNGHRKKKPFVAVNCAALAENLLESELFGHVKGAFTGAVKDSDGRFKTADGGTILLDEIGDISPRMQLRLLRVLQEREFQPVGSSRSISVDIRLIACTNRNLRELVDAGKFREDLYYRLKVIEITVPPLRNRQEDIPLLYNHFYNRFLKTFKKIISGTDDDVMEALMAYPWPGNIRELEHAIERAFVLCNDRAIGLKHFPSEITEGAKKSDLPSIEKPASESVELLSALKATGWNKAKTARMLGVSRPTVYRMMQKHGLTSPP